MAHCLMLLHRLYTLDEAAWDRVATVRARVDLFALCDRLAAVMENTARGDQDSVFGTFAEMVKGIRNGWLTEVEERSQQQQDGAGQVGWKMGSGLEMPMGMPFAMAEDDEAWFRDFVNV